MMMSLVQYSHCCHFIYIWSVSSSSSSWGVADADANAKCEKEKAWFVAMNEVPFHRISKFRNLKCKNAQTPTRFYLAYPLPFGTSLANGLYARAIAVLLRVGTSSILHLLKYVLIMYIMAFAYCYVSLGRVLQQSKANVKKNEPGRSKTPVHLKAA
jgi:hypothetical protein